MTNKEAIEFLKIIDSRYPSSLETTFGDECELIALNIAIKALEERPQGEWIYEYDDFYHCSKCGHVICTEWGKLSFKKNFPFCHCGAEMKGGAE